MHTSTPAGSGARLTPSDDLHGSGPSDVETEGAAHYYRNEPVELHQYIGAILNWSRKGLLAERSVQDLILDRRDTMRGSSYKSGASGWHRQRTRCGPPSPGSTPTIVVRLGEDSELLIDFWNKGASPNAWSPAT